METYSDRRKKEYALAYGIQCSGLTIEEHMKLITCIVLLVRGIKIKHPNADVAEEIHKMFPSENHHAARYLDNYCVLADHITDRVDRSDVYKYGMKTVGELRQCVVELLNKWMPF